MKSFRQHIVEESLLEGKDPYTSKSASHVDSHISEHDPSEHGPLPKGKADHHTVTKAGTDLHIHHVKNKEGKTTHTIVHTGGQHQNAGAYHIPGKAHPKHVTASWNKSEKGEHDDY